MPGNIRRDSFLHRRTPPMESPEACFLQAMFDKVIWKSDMELGLEVKWSQSPGHHEDILRLDHGVKILKTSKWCRLEMVHPVPLHLLKQTSVPIQIRMPHAEHSPLTNWSTQTSTQWCLFEEKIRGGVKLKQTNWMLWFFLKRTKLGSPL